MFHAVDRNSPNVYILLIYRCVLICESLAMYEKTNIMSRWVKLWQRFGDIEIAQSCFRKCFWIFLREQLQQLSCWSITPIFKNRVCLEIIELINSPRYFHHCKLTWCPLYRRKWYLCDCLTWLVNSFCLLTDSYYKLRSRNKANLKLTLLNVQK